ncbi:MAG: hypothetical protein DRP85_03115, partial [Candidatus Makaraimicrobium thalassicum]
GKSVAEVIGYLDISGKVAGKVEARELVEKVCKENGVSVKIESKSGELKKWFLSLDDSMAATSDEIKKKCVEIGMKGGSVSYYVNSYRLVIELKKMLDERANLLNK